MLSNCSFFVIPPELLNAISEKMYCPLLPNVVHLCLTQAFKHTSGAGETWESGCHSSVDSISHQPTELGSL